MGAAAQDSGAWLIPLCLAAFVPPKLPGSVSLKSASARSSEVRLLTYARKKLLGGKAA